MLKAISIMSKEVVKLKKTDRLTEAIGALRHSNYRAAAVYDKLKFVGVISRTSLLKSDANPARSTMSNFIKPAPSVGPDETIVKVAELMYGSYPCLVTVKKSGKIMGFIKDVDVIAALKKFPKLLKLKATSIMTSDLSVFKYTDRLGDAINTMREKHIGRVPVVDPQGKLVSILSFSDVLNKVIAVPKEGIHGTSVKGKGVVTDKIQLMSTNVGDEASLITTVVEAQDTVAKVIDNMSNYNISDVVVVDESKKPIGIVTTRDLLELFFRLGETDQPKAQVIGVENLKPMQLTVIQSEIEDSLEKYNKLFPEITYAKVHIKPYARGARSRIKWSVNIRLATPHNLFIASESNYDLNTASSYALQKLDKEIRRTREKRPSGIRGRGKGRRQQYDKYVVSKQRREKWTERQAKL